VFFGNKSAAVARMKRSEHDIRKMHCTIWSQGVREIVSAEDADVKFIVSHHPVTIYNPAAAREAQACSYPNDPAIALKTSQTIFAGVFQRLRRVLAERTEGDAQPSSGYLTYKGLSRKPG
jgi:hypothetical protein